MRGDDDGPLLLLRRCAVGPRDVERAAVPLPLPPVDARRDVDVAPRVSRCSLHDAFHDGRCSAPCAAAPECGPDSAGVDDVVDPDCGRDAVPDVRACTQAVT